MRGAGQAGHMAQTNVDLTSHGHGTCKRADQGDVDQGDVDQGDVDQGDADQGDVDQGDADQGDADQGDADQGDADQGDVDQGDVDQGDVDQGDVDQGDVDQGDVDQGDADQGDQGDARLHVYARAQDCRASFNCRVDALFNCAGRASLCKCVSEEGVFRKFWTECPFSVFSVNYPPYLPLYTSINY